MPNASTYGMLVFSLIKPTVPTAGVNSRQRTWSLALESDVGSVLMRSGRGWWCQRLAMKGCERRMDMGKKTLIWLLIAAALFVTWLLVLGPQAATTLLHLL